jgi:hypothetical protein
MKQTIFDVEASYLPSIDCSDKAIKQVSLASLLLSDRWKDQVQAVRDEVDTDRQKEKKQALPAFMPSGLFSKKVAEGLQRHSGFICIDIDGKDNPDMDIEQAKQQLAEFAEMAYIGLSVGGKGLFCVVPIAYPDKHGEHFLALQSDFKEIGIKIDDQCKDITRARIVSFDPNPYVNEQAEAYTFTKRKPQPKPPIKHYSHNDSEETIRKVYELCGRVQDCGLDLSACYQNWFEIGASLASIGEDGREAFHSMSRALWGSTYDFADAEKKFDNLLRTTRSYTIGTFFHICKCCGL